ncbi:hypothetical protein [Erythrobacter sp. F6033]|uniref:hypothetical protein n=1 Tax=Erythrobacter sp. F6033 TaxID=2926401 RepID=UPI001FF4729D|nr:hypothetical protein [Erythrobacter sp. F6033]MCK0128092.1 hypothetical protein [Erythrobacter sp. F6033]
MRVSHIYLTGVALATFGVVLAAPAAAQDTDTAPIDEVAPDSSAPGDLTAEQRAEYDSWAPDQKFAYDAWPVETKSYYWTLSPAQQGLFWKLSDQDKIALTAMTGPERDSAWQMIEERSAEEGGPS